MAEMPFLPGSLEPQDKYDLAADQILAQQRARRERATLPRVTVAPAPDPDLLTFSVTTESIVGKMVRQIRDAEESHARAVLKAAYDAGFADATEAAALCCGCNTSDAEDFDGFLDRLIKEANRG